MQDRQAVTSTGSGTGRPIQPGSQPTMSSVLSGSLLSSGHSPPLWGEGRNQARTVRLVAMVSEPESRAARATDVMDDGVSAHRFNCRCGKFCRLLHEKHARKPTASHFSIDIFARPRRPSSGLRLGVQEVEKAGLNPREAAFLRCGVSRSDQP